MQTFINERSAQGQCRARNEVSRLVARFVQVLDRVSDYQKRDQHWLGPEIEVFQRGDIRAECVLFFAAAAGSLVSSISDTIIKTRLSDALGRLRVLSWTLDSQQLDNALYALNGELENGTSVAEMAERKFQMPDVIGFMVNFGGCRYSGRRSVEVEREHEDGSKDMVTLDVVETLDDLEDWAAGKLYIPRPYTFSSSNPPLPKDDQTILVDRRRFERTSLRQHGRRVFRERGTGYFWYVDNLHPGGGAHFEVFDSEYRHIGTSNLSGVVDTSRRVAARRLQH